MTPEQIKQLAEAHTPELDLLRDASHQKIRIVAIDGNDVIAKTVDTVDTWLVRSATGEIHATGPDLIASMRALLDKLEQQMKEKKG